MSDLGSIIDNLGVSGEIPEGSLASSAVVLLSIVDGEGDETLVIRWSQGLSWMTRAGMLHHALAEESKDGDDS